MEILDILTILSIITTLALVYYAWKKLASNTLRAYFIIMIVFFILPMVMPFGETRTDTWMKHLLFYNGQFSLYMYLTHLIKSFKPASSENTPTKPPPSIAVAALISTQGTESWYNFLTDQGLEHFLALPLLFLIVTVIHIQYQYITDQAFKTVLNLCIAACTTLVMIHVGEFVVESQHILPFMEGDPVEITEFIWYFVALILFWFSIKKLPEHIQKTTV